MATTHKKKKSVVRRPPKPLFYQTAYQLLNALMERLWQAQPDVRASFMPSPSTSRLPLLAALALLLAATSCEKIITPKLNTSASQLVIEGNLADNGQPCLVSLTTSTDYTNTNTFPPVSGATVTLTDNAGHAETLRETPTASGQYRGATVLGVPGRTYTLRVETGNSAYVATSTLPGPVVPFDRLSTQASAIGNSVQAVVEYTDPAGPGNGYLFRQYRNGVLNNTIFVQNDQFTDGRHVTQVLRSMGQPTDADRLRSGDSLRVEMQNIDPGVYEYFRTLALILTTSAAPSTTPANPTSNFTGGALGYFSAHSRRVQKMKVP